MGRSQRLIYADAHYHIISRGIRRTELFKEFMGIIVNEREELLRHSDKRIEIERTTMRRSNYSIPEPNQVRIIKKRKSDLLIETAKVMNVSPKELRGKGKRSEIALGRWIFGYIGREYYKMKNNQIAKNLGISESSISDGIYKL